MKEQDFESMKFPGPEGSAIRNDNEDQEHLISLLKNAEQAGGIPDFVLKAFDEWAWRNGIKLSGIERKTAAIIFLAGMNHKALTKSIDSKGESFEITQEQLEDMAYALKHTKPVIKMLVDAGLKYSEWKPNIKDLVDKEFGIVRKQVILVTKK